MSRLSVPREPVDVVRARRGGRRPAAATDAPHAAPDGSRDAAGDAPQHDHDGVDGAAGGTLAALQRQVSELQRELAGARTARRRDLATARGLGEALQALRGGMTALRRENEDLRRRLALRERPR